MIKVFIGGSRKISRLGAGVRQRLDLIIERRLPVLIGDANGVDKAVQQHLLRHQHDLVEIFCMEGVCRNNLGAWPTRSIPALTKKKDFSYYSTKDKVMADEASIGFMIWDGKSIGTLSNVFRLISQNKKVVVYTLPAKKFSDLKNKEDWDIFLSMHGKELRERIERDSIFTEQKHQKPMQLNLY
jgi:adenine-specific DNA-methyltransferase